VVAAAVSVADAVVIGAVALVADAVVMIGAVVSAAGGN